MMEEIQVRPDTINYVHVFSGGLDSTYGLLRLAKNLEKQNANWIQPIFIDYGHYAALTEWRQVQNIVSFLNLKLKNSGIIREPVRLVLKSDLFGWCMNQAFTGKNLEENDCEIQNRNMVLMSILFSYLQACAVNQKLDHASFEISSGFKEGEMKDASAEFFKALTATYSIYTKAYSMNISLLPAKNLSQIFTGMKKLLHGSHTDLDRLVNLTTSCYAPSDNGAQCGKCYKCRTIAGNKRKSSTMDFNRYMPHTSHSKDA